MIIDRPTPATRNGLGNVIRGWPRWMLCQAVKKHKLCSSWRVKKAYSVGIAKSAAACCTCFSLVIILHIKYLHPLVSKPFCAAPLPSSLLPWRLICNFVRLRILGNVHTLFCNATPVPWRRVKKAYSVGIVKSAAACCTCFSLVIILHIKYLHPLVSKPFCAAPLPSSLLPWRLICNFVRLRILGNVHTLFCNATPVPWRTGRTKVALVELPTVNMFGFFFCTPFPLRILAWSFVVPRSNFHPPKTFNLIDLKEGDNWPSHTCHTKWTWKCDPRLTEMDALSSCQEA